MNNNKVVACNLYIVYFGSTTNHSYPVTFRDALTLMAHDSRYWIGRWEA